MPAEPSPDKQSSPPLVWTRSAMTRRAALGAAALGAGFGAGGFAEASAGAFRDSAIAGALGWAKASDGQCIRYEVFGKGSTTLVFVHGWTCDRTYWNQQVAAFSRDCRVLTLDLVGHGESDKTRQSWSMEGLGDDVAQTVRAAGAGRVVLIGHSMGGPVVVEAARRLGEAVAGVVTVDILTTLEPPSGPRPPPLTPSTYRAEAAKMIRTGMFPPDENPAIADRITKAMTSGSPEIALALSDALNQYDARAGLTAIAGFHLTMIDAGNRTVNVNSLRGAHSGARIFQIQAVGHFVMIDDPATFDALLRSEVALMTGRLTQL